MYIIREMIENDFTKLHELDKKTWNETYPGDLTGKELEDHLEKRSGKLALKQALNKNSLFLVVENKKTNHLIGYAKLSFKVDEGVTSLDRIYVLKIFQGKGVGSQLLSRCLEESTQRSLNKMKLIVLPTNTNAIQFYKKHGFSKTGTAQYLLGNEIEIDDEMTCNDLKLALEKIKSHKSKALSKPIELKPHLFNHENRTKAEKAARAELTIRSSTN